jgi:hypothetical protein
MMRPLLRRIKAAPDQYSALLPFRQARFNDSIAGNPYFFFPPVAGVLATPAGYAFPSAMMANHSAEYPNGYLDKETFKSFFAVSGQSGSFTYKAGVCIYPCHTFVFVLKSASLWEDWRQMYSVILEMIPEREEER